MYDSKKLAMKSFKFIIPIVVMLMVSTSCDDSLNEPLENEIILEGIDYTKTEDMIKILAGSYKALNDLPWEIFPTISVRGDDVNAAGDQVPLTETDNFNYDRSFWMYNSAWQNLYADVLNYHANMEQIELYKEFAANPS